MFAYFVFLIYIVYSFTVPHAYAVCRVVYRSPAKRAIAKRDHYYYSSKYLCNACVHVYVYALIVSQIRYFLNNAIYFSLLTLVSCRLDFQLARCQSLPNAHVWFTFNDHFFFFLQEKEPQQQQKRCEKVESTW